MEIFILFNNTLHKLTDWHDSQCLFDICKQHSLPIQSLYIYSKKINSEQYEIFTEILTPIKNLKKTHSSFFFRPDRNIDYTQVISNNFTIKPEIDKTAFYFFKENNSNSIVSMEFSANDCKKYVLTNVLDCLQTLDRSQKVVIGVSGGGDSNALLTAIVQSNFFLKENIIPVMMLGVADWDLGQDRVIKLCQELNISPIFISSQEVNYFLNLPPSEDWTSSFENYFPLVDLEIIGTLAIRLSLLHVANKMDANYIMLGYNLEDILAESFMQLVKGKLPLPFPIRIIDGKEFVYPLYNVPKKIVDGCYPKFSIENYENRFPSKLKNRAYFYYIAQMMHNIIPSLEFDLIKGFQKLSLTNKEYSIYSNDLKFDVINSTDIESSIDKWENFINHLV